MIQWLEPRRLFSGNFRVVGYLPDYEYSAAISQLDWSALTQINYFSVIPSATTGMLPTLSSNGYALSQLTSLVTVAHSHGVKVDISVSDTSHATTFPTIAASPSLTAAFVNSVKSFCTQYDLDGADLNWEPTSATASQISNFGTLINTLYSGPTGLDLSVALNSSKQQLLNATAMKDLTSVNVETYDMDYASNAPLGASESAMQTWAAQLTSAGVSTTKLNFGVPFYGRYGTSWSNSTAETYNDIVNACIQQTGQNPPPGADTLSASFANAFSDATEPWSFNGPATIAAKTQFAIANNYGGMMIWNLGQDHLNSTGQLDQYSLMPVINSVIHASAKLVIVQQPTDASLGAAIAPAVTVDVEDTDGDLVTTDNSTVSVLVASGPAGASLEGTLTEAAINGVATFSNLRPSEGGVYTLNVSDGSLTAATSGSFQVSALPSWVGSNSVATYNLASNILTVTGTTSLIADPGTVEPLIVASGASAQLAIQPAAATQIHLGKLNISGGASVSLPSASAIPLILLLQSNSLNIDPSSKLDLGNNLLDIAEGNLSSISASVQTGSGGGSWNGAGICSSAAADDTSHLTALACISNNSGAGSAILATADGAALGITDILVKYTYYGDTNLDGRVDGSDYSRIDNGVLSPGSTGWANGDFNHDGTVNGSDYTLIDNAFNTQGPPLATPASRTDLIVRTWIIPPAASSTPAAIAPASISENDLFSQTKLELSVVDAVMLESQT